MIGYDLDGTICEKCEIDKKYFDCKKEERLAFGAIREIHMGSAEVIVRPREKDVYIITSRKPKHKYITLNWLKENNIKPKEVFFMDKARTRANMIEYKASLINRFQLEKYYEDDLKIVFQLKKKCHNTQIIAVEPVIKKYKIEDFKKKSLQIPIFRDILID